MKMRMAWLPLVAATAFLAACSSTPVADVKSAPPATPAAPARQTPASVPQAAPVATQATPMRAIPPYLDPNSAISKQKSFYFDFDVFSLKPEYASQLEMHGKYLAANPQVKVRVEGNADERGSAEYNLALGQKRADAVAKALKVYGATDKQLEAISFGREKPKAVGHDEAAWALNRRVDLGYPEK